jgi:hypothetical protein
VRSEVGFEAIGLHSHAEGHGACGLFGELACRGGFCPDEGQEGLRRVEREPGPSGLPALFEESPPSLCRKGFAFGLGATPAVASEVVEGNGYGECGLEFDPHPTEIGFGASGTKA